jgi:hypothetical protein
LPSDSGSRCQVMYGKFTIGSVSLTNSAMSPFRLLMLFAWALERADDFDPLVANEESEEDPDDVSL